MPNVDGKLLSPDEAIGRGLCPECGVRLDPGTAPHHAQGHWGTDPNSSRLSDEGRQRFNLILEFAGRLRPMPREDRWREWRELFPEWHRWTVFDEVYALVRYCVYTAGGAALLVAYGSLKNHPTLLHVMLGAVGALLAVALIKLIQVHRHKLLPRADIQAAKLKMPPRWIIFAIVVVIIAWLPLVLSWLPAQSVLIRGRLPSRGPVPSPAHLSAAAPIKIAASSVPESHQPTAEQVLDFIEGFSALSGVVDIKITAPREQLPVRNELVAWLQFPDRIADQAHGYARFNEKPYLGMPPRFAGFKVLDNDQDSEPTPAPTPNPDADTVSVPPPPAVRFPTSGIVVHALKEDPLVDQNANRVIALLRQLGFNVKRGSILPLDAQNRRYLIYIQIGRASLWK
jgi:hypothetical protein